MTDAPEPTEVDFLTERLRIALKRAEEAEDQVDRLRAAVRVTDTACVEVKPLEWNEPNRANNRCWTADSILGTYCVGNEDGWFACLEDGVLWEWGPENDPRSYEGPYAAQKACAEHLVFRITSALDVRPAARAGDL